METNSKPTQSTNHIAKETLKNFFSRDVNCPSPAKGKLPTLDRPELSAQDRNIVEKVKNRIPELNQIFEEAIQGIKKASPNILKRSYIKNHFSDCAVLLERMAFNAYLAYERNMFSFAIDLWVSKNEKRINRLYQKSPSTVDFTKKICSGFYPIIQRLEFESGQKRKARGGRTFELVVQYLLDNIGVHCQRPKGSKPRKILKRVDLVIPNQETAITRPDQALFLSCKRTLRERWKQTIPERKPSWRVFLLTMDEDLSENKAEEINNLGMIVYVRDSLKNKTHLAKKQWVRRLSDLPSYLGAE